MAAPAAARRLNANPTNTRRWEKEGRSDMGSTGSTGSNASDVLGAGGAGGAGEDRSARVRDVAPPARGSRGRLRGKPALLQGAMRDPGAQGHGRGHGGDLDLPQPRGPLQGQRRQEELQGAGGAASVLLALEAHLGGERQPFRRQICAGARG